MKRKKCLDYAHILSISLVIIVGLVLTACNGVTQAQETHTIGVVNYSSGMDQVFEGFKAGMAERGYVEGKNITYIYHGAQKPVPQVIDGEVKSLLDQKIDLFLTLGTLPTLSAKKAVEGTDIPVVFAPVINPVQEGAVGSISHPGGNVTGVQTSNISPKAMEWLLKIALGTKKVYLPYSPQDKVSVMSIKPLPETASALGVELVLGEVGSPEEALAAIETLPKDVAVFFVPTPSLEPVEALVEVAAKHGLAVGSTDFDYLKAGALVSYGNSLSPIGKQAAGLAGQILKGTKPGDLPVETSDYFLNINLQTAQAIGLDIPDEILRQADTVIR